MCICGTSMRKYKVVDTFVVRDAKILVLDRPWEFGYVDKMEAVVEGKIYPFTLTHHEYWIIVRTTDDLKGKDVYVR